MRTPSTPRLMLRPRTARGLLMILFLWAISWTTGCDDWGSVKSQVDSWKTTVVDGQSAADFSKGFGVGFFNAGADLASDALDIAKAGMSELEKIKSVDAADVKKKVEDGLGAIWDLSRDAVNKAKDLNVEGVFDKFKDASEQLRKSIEEMKTTVDKYYDVMKQVAPKLAALAGQADFPAIYSRLMMGDWSDLGDIKISPEMQEAIIDTAHFLDLAWSKIANLDAYTKGLVVGTIAFEFFPWGKLVKGAGAVAQRVARINKKKGQLKKAGITDDVFDAWDKQNEIIKKGWCFAAGTLVSTAAGPVAIEHIREGDLVLAKCEQTGRQGYKRVRAAWASLAYHLVTVAYLINGVEGRAIAATPDHPLWVVDRGEFHPAGQVRAGDRLLTASGSLARVITVTPRNESQGTRVYDLDIEEYDTFFVQDDILVHNLDPKCAQFYRIVQRLMVRGVPDKTGKIIKPVDEWKAMQYLWTSIAPIKKDPKFDLKFVQTIYKMHADKTGRVVNGVKVFTPGQILPHGQTATIANRLDECQWHHFWPRRYMANTNNYSKSLTFEVAKPLHDRRGLGVDYELDSFMAKELQAFGFTVPGGYDGNGLLKNRQPAIEAAQAFFKTNPAMDDAKRMTLIQRFYRETFSIDTPQFKVDGVP